MITVEQALREAFPALPQNRFYSPAILRIFRFLFHEREFRQFEQTYPHLSGVDFVEQVLEHFDFSYSLRSDEKDRIPAQGPLIIIANHPLGSLDGLALLKMVSEVRRDVKVVSNEVMLAIKPLDSLLIPENELQQSDQLEKGGAVIIFPAGQVSRLSPKGVRDKRWAVSFVNLAKKNNAEILPVFVDGRNSAFFYSLSLLAKPLSTLWLIREMFKQASSDLVIRIGKPIHLDSTIGLGYSDSQLVKLFRKQVYGLGKSRHKDVFPSHTQVIAHPENRQLLRQEVRDCELLGETKDNKKIYLYDYQADSVLMRELGRLREFTFRSVGEGTGQRRDIDRYDRTYRHIVLWDENDLEIVGAYRIGHANALASDDAYEGLYSSTLFRYSPELRNKFAQTIELGRSFVQPQYWGLRGLDYLWYGIGAYLNRYPGIRYLMGPVSISGQYPSHAKELLVAFYDHYFSGELEGVTPRQPFIAEKTTLRDFGLNFSGCDYKADFAVLKAALQESDLQIPTLYKQYTEIVGSQGAQFLGFNVDAAFGDCIDGFIFADLSYLKAKHRKRYLGAEQAGPRRSH